MDKIPCTTAQVDNMQMVSHIELLIENTLLLPKKINLGIKSLHFRFNAGGKSAQLVRSTAYHTLLFLWYEEVSTVILSD